MSEMILILGSSGTGKSSSLRKFTEKDSVGYVSTTGKPLPFKNEIPQMRAKSYAEVQAIVRGSKAEVMVLDDLNYLMFAAEIEKAKETGYAKFTEFAVNLSNVFDEIAKKDSNQRFYVMAHPEDKGDTNQLDFMISAGKMSKKFPIVGRANIVLETAVVDGDFVFRTKTDGSGVKVPLGMIDTPTIPNDLKELDKLIVEFYKPVTKEKK